MNKKAGWLIPVLILGGVGYYLYKKHASTAATSGATAASGGNASATALVPTLIANQAPASVASAVTLTNFSPVSGGLTPINAVPVENPFTTGNPYLSVIPGL